MEFMSQYDAKIVYIKGKDNMVVDALSHLPVDVQEKPENTASYVYAYCPNNTNYDAVAAVMLCEGWDTAYSVATMLASLGPIDKPFDEVCATFAITTDRSLLKQIHDGYVQDKWIEDHLMKAKHAMPGIQSKDGLLGIN